MYATQLFDFEKLDTVIARVDGKSSKATYLSIINSNGGVICPAIMFQYLNLAKNSVIAASVKYVPREENKDIVLRYDATIFDSMYDRYFI